MEAILIANDATMRQNIITGKKRITIRKGRRDYKIDLLVCGLTTLSEIPTKVQDLFYTKGVYFHHES